MEVRAVLLSIAVVAMATGAEQPKAPPPAFQTSDRCMACHNGLLTPSGEDVSIGYDWRASMMANSSRDPYWLASVRRESLDHPESKSDIEDECSICHMPITRYDAKVRGEKGKVFAHLALDANEKIRRKAEDGVSCSVCHQIGTEKLGTRESFNGGFVVDAPDSRDDRPEYGPFEIKKGQTRIMGSSSEGYRPKKDDHIRQSEVCATCHTLYTKALGPGGKVTGELPEQMPYQEWLHSGYKDTKSCQNCHMPAIREQAPITRVLGVLREGASRHAFVAANFFMQRMLNRFRDELRVKAMASEMTSASDRSVQYLQTQAARVAVEKVERIDGRLRADVVVENLGGHKLPTAYPSRRAWLHVVVRDSTGRAVFESGALNPDGSIQGNDNDADATRFEPHYDEIRSADQVQIYESIAGDPKGAVTTGLLTAVRYLKDNRLLPHGFDKTTAGEDVAVKGEAAADANFTGGGDRVRYSIPVTGSGPFEIEAELLYQPIGYRWASNLKKYDALEPQRFSRYYDTMSSASATRLDGARITW